MSPASKNRFFSYWKNLYDRTPGWLRKVLTFSTGGFVLLAGIVMIFTPGPALILIPGGLAILSLEFAWAAWILKKGKQKLGLESKNLPQWARSSEEESPQVSHPQS